MIRRFQCPNCKQVWDEYHFFHSEGNCLTEPEICGWEDALVEVIENYDAEGYDQLYKEQQRLYDIMISKCTFVSIAQITDAPEWAEFDKARKEASEYYDAWQNQNSKREPVHFAEGEFVHLHAKEKSGHENTE